MIQTLASNVRFSFAQASRLRHQATHKIPSAKTRKRPNLARLGRWRPRIIGIGESKVAKSVAMLAVAFAYQKAVRFTQHLPSGVLAHAFSTGRHCTMVAMTLATLYRMMKPMRNQIQCRNLFELVVRKTWMYSARIDNLVKAMTTL